MVQLKLYLQAENFTPYSLNQALVAQQKKFTSISNNFMNVDYLSNKKNDLELIAIESYPRLKSLKNFLVKLPNAKFVRMTGSGSTMIAYFNSSESCKEAAKKVKKQFRNYWCKTSKTI